MSLDIFFLNSFTLEEVESKTDIKVEYQKDNYWFVKNGSTVLVNIHKDDEDKQIYVDGISAYGINSPYEILDDIVLTFQTLFITDNEFELFGRGLDLNVEKLYHDTTVKFGFKLENGVITNPKS